MKWDCEIDGNEYKIIKTSKKDRDSLMSVPLTKERAEGVHIVLPCSEQPKIHLDEYINQQNVGKSWIKDYRFGSIATSPNGAYVNTSGAVSTRVIPFEESIKEILVRSCSGSAQIIANTSGYVGIVRKY